MRDTHIILEDMLGAIGNILRHEYDRVTPKIIWDVVTYELDAFEVALSAELSR